MPALSTRCCVQKGHNFLKPELFYHPNRRREASTTRKKVDFIIKTTSIHRCPTRQKAAMTKKVMSKNQKIIISTNYRWPTYHWYTGCGAIQTNGWDILDISVHFCCWITGVEDLFLLFKPSISKLWIDEQWKKKIDCKVKNYFILPNLEPALLCTRFSK